MIPTRTIILRQLANGAGWTFSWSNNTLDSICNLHLPPFPTKEDAEGAAQRFISSSPLAADETVQDSYGYSS